MIKFFRKIRQRMIKENRLSKYLLYAIGEILLVVIGILIAVQINNWNENRKANAEELVVLESLHENLISAKIQSENLISSEQKLISTLIRVLDIDSIGSGTNRDSISDRTFKDALWNLTTAFPILNRYDDLKSANKLSLIRNQEIKEKFTLIEVKLEDVKLLSADRATIQQVRIDGIAENDVNFLLFLNGFVPQINIENESKNDYKQILMSQRIRNLLGIKLFMTQNLLNSRRTLGKEIDKLIVSIESELNERKK